MTRAWLKEIRAEKSLTQAALAASAGIKPARYSRIEAGYCDLREDEAASLAKALNQSVEFIKNGSKPLKTKKADTAAASVQPEPTPAVAIAKPIEAPKIPVIAPKGLSAAHTNEPLRPSARGDDLTDPKNFSLLPPTGALERDGLTPAEFKSRLQQHNTFAEKVLHTSKVTPRIWVAWRDFHKEVQTLLRAGMPAPVTPAPLEPKPLPKPSAVVPAVPVRPAPTAPAPTKPLSRNARGNKNIFGYFVEVAKESLPPEKYAVLNTLATEAKEKQPEFGFMKHFRRLAETELSPTEFSKLAAEAAHRFSL